MSAGIPGPWMKRVRSSGRWFTRTVTIEPWFLYQARSSEQLNQIFRDRQFPVFAPTERRWRGRQVRASVVEKLRAAWVRQAPSGFFDSAQRSAVSRDRSMRRSARDDVFLWRVGDAKNSVFSHFYCLPDKLALVGTAS